MKKVIFTLILAWLILLPAFTAFADVLVEPETELTDIGDDESDIPVLIIVLVAAVVLVTFVLIMVFWKVKKTD